MVEELYDVAVLPGVIRPSAIGFRTDEIRFLVRPARRVSLLRSHCRRQSNAGVLRLIYTRRVHLRVGSARYLQRQTAGVHRRHGAGDTMALKLSQLDGTNGFRLDGIDS